MEVFAYILCAVFGLSLVVFMFGAMSLAGEADRQSEAMGRQLKYGRPNLWEAEAQDNKTGKATGPRKVKPV